MNFKRFDVATELQNLRSTPAKVAKPAKPAPEISNFSGGSRGTLQNCKILSSYKGPRTAVIFFLAPSAKKTTPMPGPPGRRSSTG
jgi:hypothetical protein